ALGEPPAVQEAMDARVERNAVLERHLAQVGTGLNLDLFSFARELDLGHDGRVSWLRGASLDSLDDERVEVTAHVRAVLRHRLAALESLEVGEVERDRVHMSGLEGRVDAARSRRSHRAQILGLDGHRV